MNRAPGMPVFVGVSGALMLAMPWAGPDARHLLFVAIAVVTAIPICLVLPRMARADRLPFTLLAMAIGWLVVTNTVAYAGPSVSAVSDVLMTVSNLHLLAAAVALVLRRGRNDVGGLLDATVFTVLIAGLLWTLMLMPRLERSGAGRGQQLTLLATVLLLAGVLGALLRLIALSERRSVPLLLFAGAVSIELAGDLVTIMITGSISRAFSPWLEMIFMPAYICLGLAVLHPDARSLAAAGPAPDDRLTIGRLIFLGAGVSVFPLVAGYRELAGLPGDGALLFVGDLMIVPLVMVRVGRLARQRERAERLLRHQATHDLLTGLPNRAELWLRLDAALRREQHDARPSVVVLFCDLNGFKQVNDTLGHLAGDALLSAVAERLRAGLPVGDTVARYGGDEFVLVCEERAQDQAARRLTAYVRDVLAEPVLINGAPVRVGASVGAVLSDGRLGADDLIRRADDAMYRDKEQRAQNAVVAA